MFLILFLQELRRSFFTSLFVLAGTFGALIGIERVYMLIAPFLVIGGGDRSLDLSFLTRFLVPVCSFGLGAATFSRRVKESHILFLQTLPLNRRWVWLALVAARVLAFLFAVPLVLGVLAVVWTPSLRKIPGPAAALALWACAICFGAGLCVATLFRRTLSVYLGGGLLSLFIGQHVVLNMSNFADLETAANLRMASLIVPFVAVSAALCLVSCRTFVFGDFPHTRRRLKNWAFVAFVLVALFGLLQSRQFVEFLAGWRWELLIADVSPDGGHLSVVEKLRGHSRVNRHRVIDVGTGRTLIERPLTSVDRQLWTAGSKVLAITSYKLPRLVLSGLLPGRPMFVQILDRLAVDSVTVNRSLFDSDGIQGLETSNGQLLLFMRNVNRDGAIRLMDPVSGAEREIVHVEAASLGWLFKFGNEVLIDAPDQLGGNGQAWILGHELREIQSLPLPKTTVGDRRCSLMVQDTVYRSFVEYQAVLGRMFGKPVSGSASRSEGPSCYVVPGDAGLRVSLLEKSTTVFYLQSGPEAAAPELCVYRPPSASWRKLTDLLPLEKKPFQFPSPTEPVWIDGSVGDWFWGGSQRLRDHFHLDVRPIEGIAVFLDVSHDPSVAMLYDARLDQLLELGEVSDRSTEESSVGILTVAGTDGLIVWMRPSASAAAWTLFRYHPEVGRLESIGTVRTHPDLFLYFEPGGRRIEKDSANGTIVTRTPGAKPLQLWP